MALWYQKDQRELSMRGRLFLSDGSVRDINADNIVRYSIEEASTAGGTITIGDARASSYSLDIEDVAHEYTAAQLIGAMVEVEISLDGIFDPLGVWYVDSAEISRQSATVSITGTDALGSKMDALYVDGEYPATLGDIARRVAAQAGLALKSGGFANSDIVVDKQPEWNTDTNAQRAVIAYIAGCAGGFARIDRVGRLEIVPYTMAQPETITADYFTTLSVGGGKTFAFGCLQVAYYGSNIYTRYALDESQTDTAGNTLRISDNPLMTEDIAHRLVEQLTGLESTAVTVDWVGDPTLVPGVRVSVQDTDGSMHTGIITSQTISVDGSLHAQTMAELPDNISSAFVDTIFTPAGKISIQAFEGQLDVWAADRIKIAVGKELDNFAPTQVIDGSQLVITKDEIRMETPIFSVNVTGERGDMTLDEDGLSAEYINSPSVRPMYYGPAALTVQTDSADGISTFATLSDAFYRLNGRYLAYPVTIYVRSAQPEARAELSYTDGAPITICKAADVSTPAINAHLDLIAVRNILTLEGINVGYTSGDNCVTASGCMCVISRTCNFVTSTATLSTAHAFFVERSQAEFYSCGFFNGYGGVFGERMAHIYIEGCKGAGLKYGVAVRYGSRASGSTSIPPGSTNASYATADSEYRGTSTTASGTSPFAPATTNTIELDLTNTRTYAGGWYGSGTTMIAQGVSGGTNFRGYMWFDFSPISGRTIKQAALKLYRKAGIGKSAYADIYIGAARVAGPGSTVEASKEYGKVGAAAQNSRTQISVPVEAMQAIADGTYNALYVYSPQSEDYAAFEGVGESNPPRLAVLY